MKSINARLDEMTKKLSSKDLFESNGLGNEINFHVFDYDPEDEYIVREYLENYLLKKEKLNIKVFDIYDIILSAIISPISWIDNNSSTLVSKRLSIFL